MPAAPLYSQGITPPAPRTPFIGRDREVAAVAGLLASDGVTLLTLTGPGGSGKTRLALAVASSLGDAYPDGIVFVLLASITDDTLVESTIAHALGVRGQVGGAERADLSVAHQTLIGLHPNHRGIENVH